MSKKAILIIISILLTCSIIVGVSYARWAMTNTQTTINKLTSSCFSMELTNEKDSINLSTTYPITDNEGKKLTPYQFTITNTCDLFASYTINLEMLEGTTLNSKYIKTLINSEAITNLGSLETTTPTISGATESRVLFKGSLGAGDSVDYTFRLWMDYDTPLSSDTVSKVFNSKITITSEPSTYSPVENGFTLLNEALLVNEYQTTSVDVAKNKIASKQDVDTTKTAPIIDWQETIENDLSSVTFTEADESELGNYGVVENAIKTMFGSSYTFNSETGYYTLTNTAYYDPNEVDFSSNTYYICGSAIGPAGANITYYDNLTCTKLYKVDSLASVIAGTITLSTGNKVKINRYEYNVYKMSETERESDKSDKGLYETLDDYGTTYYYRGNVTNNIVKFAGYYWQVVRINGDGSIRLLYAGSTPNAVGSALGLGGSSYSLSGDLTYVGYMYSNTLKTSYLDTIKNDNDSTIKTKLDSWYKTNIVDKSYSTYIADSGFCNDRTLYVGNGYSNSTQYAPNRRIETFSPSYICPNPSNDLFTLAGNSEGNGKLTYPVGLITSDELAFAGMASGYLNKMSYTYSTASYWTMSPAYYHLGISTAYVFVSYVDGNMNAAMGYTYTNNHVRPVINLKADTEITSGIGTKNDPFIVK